MEQFMQQDLWQLCSPHLKLETQGQCRKEIHLRPPITLCLRQVQNLVFLRFTHYNASSTLAYNRLFVVVAVLVDGCLLRTIACLPNRGAQPNTDHHSKARMAKPYPSTVGSNIFYSRSPYNNISLWSGASQKLQEEERYQVLFPSIRLKDPRYYHDSYLSPMVMTPVE